MSEKHNNLSEATAECATKNESRASEDTDAATEYGKYTDLMAFYKIAEHRVIHNNKETDFYSPIYGYTIPVKDVSAKYDERLSEKSIHRHSPYFTRRRAMRQNVETYYDRKFFPERYAEEYPLSDEKREIINPAILEISKDRKKIRVIPGIELEIYNDGFVMLFDLELKPHSITANRNKITHDVTNEYYEHKPNAEYRPPDTYTAVLNSFSDTLGANGGSVKFNIVLSRNRMVFSELSVELDVHKIPADMVDNITVKSKFPIKNYSPNEGCLA